MNNARTIKSKYPGYGEVSLTETGHDYDFIATIQNDTDKKLVIYVDDLEGWYQNDENPIIVPPNDWVGLEANVIGRQQLESIKAGDFKVVALTMKE